MSNQSGFTLVEVLVALTILTIGLNVLFQGLDGGLRGASVADHQRIATENAQSLLDELGRSSPLIDGVTEGAFPEGERWRLSVTPFVRGESQGTHPLLSAHLVALRVTWQAGIVEQELDFRTLRLRADK